MRKLVLVAFLFSYYCFAQVQKKVGDNAYTINSSAVFEVESTTKGLLLPRMTTAQRDAITSPAEGLVIYNTTTKRLETNLGSAATPIWTVSGGSVSTWTLSVGYAKNELVVYTDGQVYRANASIPANTAWAIGTTGATWAAVINSAAKATNLIGGNNTTLLGAIPYQSNTDVTTLLTPNTTTTTKVLTQTGTGTNGAAPVWGTLVAADIPTLNQNTTGTAANVTGTVAIANGGSGQTTQQAAINALTGTQSSGKYLRSDGTNATLSAIAAADVPTLNQNTTGSASKSTNLIGGNNTTLLGAMPYQSNTDVTTLLTPNTTTTKKVLTQTGTGTNGAAPVWGTLVAADIPTLNQNTTGTAANVTGTVAIANGGSGQTTQQAAINALTGTQSSGKYLRSDGTNATLSAIAAADVPTLNQNTTGSAGKSTNLIGGNNTTLLGAIPYQSNTDVTTLLAPNTTTTKKVLTQTGTGTNGAAPVWETAITPKVTLQTSSATKPTSPNAADVLIVTNDGTATGLVKEVWNYTGTDWIKIQGTDAVSGAVLDNTVANSASITTPGRYIVPATGTAGSFVGQESKFADYDGVSFTFSTPTDLIKIVITTGVNVGQTWQYTAANPTKWAQVVSSAISIYPWVLSGAYTAGTVVNYQGNLYQANGTITANTAFTVGTTGATWAAYLKIDDKYAVPTTPVAVAAGQSMQTAIANLQGQVNGKKTLYADDGTLAANRTVALADKTLAITSTATTGTSHLTIDGTTFNIDAVNNRVGVGTSSPLATLDVRNGAAVGISAGTANSSLIASVLNVSTGTALDGTVASRELALRMTRGGTNGTKWNMSADFLVGTYNVGINSQTQLDIRLANAGTNSTDTDVMTLRADGKVGINTTTPSTALDVNGQIKISGGAPGAGKVLSSDANGLASWADNPNNWPATGASVAIPGYFFRGKQVYRYFLVGTTPAQGGEVQLLTASNLVRYEGQVQRGNATDQYHDLRLIGMAGTDAAQGHVSPIYFKGTLNTQNQSIKFFNNGGANFASRPYWVMIEYTTD
nr:hypothetical protein [uncultured Flavobacterium sp.]